MALSTGSKITSVRQGIHRLDLTSMPRCISSRTWRAAWLPWCAGKPSGRQVVACIGLLACIFTVSVIAGFIVSSSTVHATESDPEPRIGRIVFPPEIVLGQAATITVYGRNCGGQSSEAYLAVSFPSNPDPSHLSILESDATNSKIYWPGEQIWADYGQYQVVAQYPLAEAWQFPWPSLEERVLKIQVVPDQVGEFEFFVKMTARDMDSTWFYYPSAGDVDPQQNEYAYSRTINVVLPYADAEINNLDGTTQSVNYGETGTVQYSFTNTGTIDWTFGAGATLTKPDGTPVNLALQSVSLGPKQSTTVSWPFAADQFGQWNLRCRVWEEAATPVKPPLADTGDMVDYLMVEDPTPPIIAGVTFSSLPHSAGDDVKVFVRDIRDIESGVSSMRLYYQLPGQALKSVSMQENPDGGDPDDAKGIIPGWDIVSVGGIKFYVEATNHAGLLSRNPGNPGEYHSVLVNRMRMGNDIWVRIHNEQDRDVETVAKAAAYANIAYDFYKRFYFKDPATDDSETVNIHLSDLVDENSGSCNGDNIYVNLTTDPIYEACSWNVIAHELMHSIQYSYASKSSSDIFLWEGMAMWGGLWVASLETGGTLAEVAHYVIPPPPWEDDAEKGFTPFLNHPDVDFFRWDGGLMKEYVAAYLFCQYLVDGHGGVAVLERILDKLGEGYRGTEAVAEAVGTTEFATLFSEWVQWNWLDGYFTLDHFYKDLCIYVMKQPLADHFHDQVNPWAADYFSLEALSSNADGLLIDFQSAGGDNDFEVKVGLFRLGGWYDVIDATVNGVTEIPSPTSYDRIDVIVARPADTSGEYDIRISEVVSFPASTLEAAVRDAIGKSSGPITDSDLETLASLDASGKDIDDVSGLQSCPNLTSLRLRDNRISDIAPLAALTSLHDLDLRGNQVGDLSPLVANPGLGSGDVINLCGNPLSPDSMDVHIPELQNRGVTVIYDPGPVPGITPYGSLLALLFVMASALLIWRHGRYHISGTGDI